MHIWDWLIGGYRAAVLIALALCVGSWCIYAFHTNAAVRWKAVLGTLVGGSIVALFALPIMLAVWIPIAQLAIAACLFVLNAREE